MNIMSFALGLQATVAVCAVAARSEPFTANRTRDASEFHTVELYRRYKEDSGKRLGEEEFVVELLKCTPFLTSWHEPGAMGGIDFKFTPLQKYKYIQKLEETGKIDRDKLRKMILRTDIHDFPPSASMAMLALGLAEFYNTRFGERPPYLSDRCMFCINGPGVYDTYLRQRGTRSRESIITNPGAVHLHGYGRHERQYEEGWDTDAVYLVDGAKRIVASTAFETLSAMIVECGNGVFYASVSVDNTLVKRITPHSSICFYTTESGFVFCPVIIEPVATTNIHIRETSHSNDITFAQYSHNVAVGIVPSPLQHEVLRQRE